MQKQKGDYFLLQKLLEIELKADEAHCAQPKKGTQTQRRWSTPSSRIERARRSSSRTSSSCPARRSCCNVSIGQKEMTREVKQMPGYSCALMSDILLQGHLYVTENYIAFHSNVFGYVTRVIDSSSSLLSLSVNLNSQMGSFIYPLKKKWYEGKTANIYIFRSRSQ